MALLLTGCSRSGFSIPERDGPLTIDLRYPLEATAIASDSVATWGTVGTGRATLRVNDRTIPVENNGTFAAFVALPSGPRRVLRFVATKGSDSVVREISIVRNGDGDRATTDTVVRQWSRWVSMRRLPSDTADSATQWRPIYSRWRPRGGVALALPQGMRFLADARTTSSLRLRIASDLRVWVPLVDADTTALPDRRSTTATTVEATHDSVAIRIRVPLGRAVPSTVELSGDRLYWTLYGVDWGAPPPDVEVNHDPVRRVRVRRFAPGGTLLDIGLTRLPLGWRSEWQDGAMVLSVRLPLRKATTLRGLRVLLDPGHPPDGTTGPSGLREDSVTLAVAREVASGLRALGADVSLTREGSAPVSLEARAAMITTRDPHVFLSIHANSPGPGRPPTAVHGTQVYWMQGNSRMLAKLMVQPVARALDHPALGAYLGEYAVLRPTWAPAVIIEGLPLILPEREAFLRTSEGIAAYARGIVDGTRRWALSRESFTLRFPHTPGERGAEGGAALPAAPNGR